MPELTCLQSLEGADRLLLTVPLKPALGDRFQPTGFPSLGAATYQTTDGLKLLVESSQSMANRLEQTCWDDHAKAPVPALAGVSHITVTRKGAFLTDSMLEAHRINSPYLLEGRDKQFFNRLKAVQDIYQDGAAGEQADDDQYENSWQKGPNPETVNEGEADPDQVEWNRYPAAEYDDGQQVGQREEDPQDVDPEVAAQRPAAILSSHRCDSPRRARS